MGDDVKVIHPKNLGWLEKKLNQDEVNYLWKCVESSNVSIKDRLVGQIAESNYLIDFDNWFFNNTILPLCLRYSQEFCNIGDLVPVNNRHPYYLELFWANFQNKNEFNPVHAHKGVYSFVIWMKIPTRHQEQNQNPIASRALASNISTFQFFYSDILGYISETTYEMNPEIENTMLFFPSLLCHSVNPFFNSDKKRISISGNVSLDTTRFYS